MLTAFPHPAPTPRPQRKQGFAVARLCLVLCCLMWLPLTLWAEKWRPETLPMVYLQDARRHVCNPDHILDPATVAQADSLLTALERDKGVQTVVAVVKQLEGDDPYAFGMALGKRYGIGSKEQRTGLIILLATEDRSYQILTGNGLEGTLPDALCRRIENRVMVPELKNKHWDAAILLTLQAIDGIVRDDPTITNQLGEDEEDTADIIAGIICLVVFMLFLVVAIYYGWRSNRCPVCKKAQLKITQRRKVRHTKTGERFTEITLTCPKCGHSHKRRIKDNDNQGGAFAGGMAAGSLLGGGGSGGGRSFGGTFGGGSFGGGGSGGRF